MSDLTTLWDSLQPPPAAATIQEVKQEESPLKQLWEKLSSPLRDSGKMKEYKQAPTQPIGNLQTIDTVFQGLIKAESGGQHLDKKTGKLLTSSAGARGITQLMPKTAANPGYGITPVKDDSEEEYTRVGKAVLEKMYNKYGDWELALAAYNAGVGNVDKARGKADRFGGNWKDYLPKPSETLPYINKILGKGDKSAFLTPKEKMYEGTSGEQMVKNAKETAYDIASMLPITGDAMSVLEGYDGFREGDPLKMASGALGAMPFITAGIARKAVHGTLSPESLVKGFDREAADAAGGKYAVLGEGFYFSRKGGKTDWANEYAGFDTRRGKGYEPGGAVFPNELSLKKPLFFSAEWANAIPPAYNQGGFKGIKQFTKTQGELADFIKKSGKSEYSQFLDTRSKDTFTIEAIKPHLPEKALNGYHDELDILFVSEKTEKGLRDALDKLDLKYLTEWKKEYPSEYSVALKEGELRDKLRITNANNDPKNFSNMLREAGFDGVVDLPENQYMVLDAKNITNAIDAKYAKTLGTRSKGKQNEAINNLIPLLEKEGKIEEANKLRGLLNAEKR